MGPGSWVREQDGVYEGAELETGSQGRCGLFFLTDNTRGAHSLNGLQFPGGVSSKLCRLG